MKAHSKAGIGQGWHKESLRHSRAKKLGTAGGLYRNTHGQIMTDPIAIAIHKMLKPQKSYARKLAQGAKVEREHAETIAKIKKNPTITSLQAEELIAKDHLREDPLYYKKLATIETPRQTKIDFLMKSHLHNRSQLEQMDDAQLNELTQAGLEATAPVQIIEVHPARGASEEAQDKLIIESAREENLNPTQLGAFAYFMKHRLKGEQDPRYTSEWARRFKEGRAWDKGDYESRKVLKESMRRYAGFKKDDHEYMEIDTAHKKGYRETPRFKGETAYEDAVASAESHGLGKYHGYTSFMDGSVIAYYK